MCNNRHLTLDDRLIIERELFFNLFLKKISVFKTPTLSNFVILSS